MDITAKCAVHPEKELNLEITPNALDGGYFLTVFPCEVCEEEHQEKFNHRGITLEALRLENRLLKQGAKKQKANGG